MVPRLPVGNALLNSMMTRGKTAFNSKANSGYEAGDGAQMDRMLNTSPMFFFDRDSPLNDSLKSWLSSLQKVDLLTALGKKEPRVSRE